MKFDKAKDQELGKWECDGLIFTVKQYNGGAAKLQIGPRIVESRDAHGNPIDVFAKAGRLNFDELQFLLEHSVEMLAKMTKAE